MIDIEQSSAALQYDERPNRRQVGLVALATDYTTERDFERMLGPAGIAVYTARIPYANPTTPDNLRRMQPGLAAGAGLILPDEPLDAICYSCTSASVVIGDAAVAAAIGTAQPNVPVVTPPLAATRGLRALGASRISILTPYTITTSQPMADYFRDKGFDLASFTCLGLEDDRQMARLSAETLVERAVAATHATADALFISCTALRSAAVAARIEQRIGRPVVTSNQASAWAILRLCGDRTAYPEWGRLLALPGETA